MTAEEEKFFTQQRQVDKVNIKLLSEKVEFSRSVCYSLIIFDSVQLLSIKITNKKILGEEIQIQETRFYIPLQVIVFIALVQEVFFERTIATEGKFRKEVQNN